MADNDNTPAPEPKAPEAATIEQLNALNGVERVVVSQIHKSPGVFFAQTRVGKGNRDFRLFKFRTMKPDSEKAGQITVGGRDSRIYRVTRGQTVCRSEVAFRRDIHFLPRISPGKCIGHPRDGRADSGDDRRAETALDQS